MPNLQANIIGFSILKVSALQAQPVSVNAMEGGIKTRLQGNSY